MLKDFIKEKGISVYSVSKGSGVPYTTLNELVNGKKKVEDCSIKTIAALAAYFHMTIDRLYFTISEVENTAEKNIQVNQTWEANRNKTFIFPVIVASQFYDASRIYPLKQKKINDLYNSISQDNRIASVYLFGSSVNIRCTKKSDIDLAVELKPEFVTKKDKNELSEKIQETLDWTADIIWRDTVTKDSKLDKNIMKGVQII